MSKNQGKSYAKGKYVAIGMKSGKVKIIWLNTNEEVGIFETRKEAEEQADIWNELKKKTGERPI